MLTESIVVRGDAAAMNLPRAVICDVDGTITDCSHRRHLVAEVPRDWGKFHYLMGEDLPNAPVVELVRTLDAAGYQILLTTGRDWSYREQTELWLTFNEVPWSSLSMRAKGDLRADFEVKRGMLKELRALYDIRFVVDDRSSVVKMWREEGLCCFQCAEGDF